MSFSGSACIRSTYSCVRTFFLIHQIRISRACLRIATRLQVCNYINSEPKASQQTLPEEKAQNVWDLCLYLCTQESLYISLHKSTYVCTIHILMFLFLFRCIHTYIHIYVDITSDTPKRQRIKYWSPLCNADRALVSRGEAPGKGKPLVPWCGRSLVPSHHHWRVLWPPLALLGEPAGLALVGAAGWEQDRTGMGTREAVTRSVPAGSPAMLQVSPAAAQPSQGRRGWGRGGEACFPRLNFIHPSTVSQVAFKLTKSKKYIHRCSLVYLLTLCNLFALICFCLSWDFPF